MKLFVKEKVKDYIRVIEKISIIKKGNLITFKLVGDGFLRYMVRMIIGILVEIGKGRKDQSFIEDRLDKKELKRSNYKVSSCGLYLVKVNY